MTKQVRLLVNRLDVPAGHRDGDDKSLPHRTVAAWGVQQLTGTLADVTLLLVAHRLVVDTSWSEAAPQSDKGFTDPPELIGNLARAGLIESMDMAQEFPDVRAQAETVVEAAIADFWPWLRACQGISQEWDSQDDLIGAVWDHAKAESPGWRDALRAAGLSILKHNYRNQTQAVTALLTLMEWQEDEQSDEPMIREAIGREVTYLSAGLAAACATGTIPHDWIDHRPLYALLAPEGLRPLLTVRVPGVNGADLQRAADILSSDAAAEARDMVAVALAGGKASARDVEASILGAVPREVRTPYAYRQVNFYRFDPVRLAHLDLPPSEVFALSEWRSGVQQ